MTALAALVRAVHLASLMTVFGASAYLVLIRRLQAAPRDVKLFAAALTALATAPVFFAITTARMNGDWHAGLDPAALRAVAEETLFGRIFLLRVALLAAAATLAWRRRGLGTVAALSGAALAALGPTSHAAANGGGPSSVFAATDAIHLLCGGFWIGSLVVIARMLRRRGPDFVAALAIFSAWGTGAVALVAIAGAINVVAIIPRNPAQWSLGYMTLLSVKIMLAALMIALALANRFRLAPELRAGSAEAEAALAWNVAAELGFGACVIVLAAFLGVLAPAT